MGHVFGRRHIDDMAVADSTLGDHLIGERLHLRPLALEHRHFQAAFVIEVPLAATLPLAS